MNLDGRIKLFFLCFLYQIHCTHNIELIKLSKHSGQKHLKKNKLQLITTQLFPQTFPAVSSELTCFTVDPLAVQSASLYRNIYQQIIPSSQPENSNSFQLFVALNCILCTNKMNYNLCELQTPFHVPSSLLCGPVLYSTEPNQDESVGFFSSYFSCIK